MRNIGLSVALAALAACGGGPAEPFMTALSTAHTKAAVEACAQRVTTGQTLARLTTSGFAASGNSFVARSENPRMLVGGSIVRARMESRQSCLVTSEPVTFDEMPKIQAMVREAVANADRPVDGSIRFNPGAGQVRIAIR